VLVAGPMFRVQTRIEELVRLMTQAIDRHLSDPVDAAEAELKT
jgi:hypothetical protein